VAETAHVLALQPGSTCWCHAEPAPHLNRIVGGTTTTSTGRCWPRRSVIPRSS
jgi:hypothetical protein